LKQPSETSLFDEGPVFVQSMLETYGLWREPLRDLCRRATEINVGDVMHVPGPAEYVEEDATLDEVIHRLLAGRYLSLLVIQGESIVGVLRVSDVFQKIYELARGCRI
jgi:predicted transcriptional regulator